MTLGIPQPVAASAEVSGYVTVAWGVLRFAGGGDACKVGKVATKYTEFNKKVPGLIK